MAAISSHTTSNTMPYPEWLPADIESILDQLNDSNFIKPLFFLIKKAGYLSETTRIKGKLYWHRSCFALVAERSDQDAPGPIHWQCNPSGDLWLSIEIEDIATLERSTQKFLYSPSAHDPSYHRCRGDILNQNGFCIHLNYKGDYYNTYDRDKQDLLDNVRDLLNGRATKPIWEGMRYRSYRLASSNPISR